MTVEVSAQLCDVCLNLIDLLVMGVQCQEKLLASFRSRDLEGLDWAYLECEQWVNRMRGEMKMFIELRAALAQAVGNAPTHGSLDQTIQSREPQH